MPHPDDRAKPPDPDAPLPTPAPSPADELDLAVHPVSAKVRSDVGRLHVFLQQIRTGYLKTGVLLLVLVTLAGTAIPILSDFSDWYMHLAMYLVLTSFGLLYMRAHLRRFRFLEVLWTLLFGALLAYFSWVLIDLVPARLDVLSDRIRPDGLIGPEVALRPDAPLLWVPVVLLWIELAWLLTHALLVAPASRRPRVPADPS